MANSGLKHTLADGPPLIRVYLFGPLRVIGEDGQDLTPRSKKAQAIFAMLALAPRGVRSRVWLRHKLWSVKDKSQASSSLRQSLLEIRRALGPAENRCIQADKNTVALNLDVVEVDYIELSKSASTLDPTQYAADTFLDGLEIADSEFSEWRDQERALWTGRLQTQGLELSIAPKRESPDSSARQTSDPDAPSAIVLVHLLPPRISGEIEIAHRLLPAAHRTLLKSLRDVGDFVCSEPKLPVTELWGNANPQWTMDLDEDAMFSFQFRIASNEGRTQISLVIQAPKTGDILWSKSNVLTTSSDRSLALSAQELIAEATEKLQQLSLKEVGERAIVSTLLSKIMDLSFDDLAAAEAQLSNALSKWPKAPQFHALQAFLMTFKVGQRFQFEDAHLIDKAQEHSMLALEHGEENALVGALTAHVHSYLFGEYDFAAGLFERALAQNPTQILAWDLYSMLHAYAGKPRQALAMANWACNLGEQSPYRYYFETTRAITACFAGQHERALTSGELALSERPQFNSILRVLVSSSAHLGRMKLSHSYLERLLAVEPDFTIEALRQAGYPGLDTEGGKHFVQGLLKAGVSQN